MNLLIYFLQVTVCLSLFYALYYFALQKETTYSFNRLYLLLTLVISAVLPLITIYIDLSQTPVLDNAAEVFVAPYTDSIDALVIQSRTVKFDFMIMIPIIYWSGVVFFILKLIKEIVAIHTIRRKGIEEEVFGHACIFSNGIKAPFSFAGTIYLPNDHAFSDEELVEVIRHERAHTNGYHSIDVMLMEIMQVFLWPCLPIYLYKRKMRELHEFFADAEVIKYSPWDQYARFLIAQKENQLQYRLSNHLVYSQLKNRFIMMTQRPSSTMSRLKYFGILPVLFVSTVFLSFKEKEFPQTFFPLVSNELKTQSAIDTVDDEATNAIDSKEQKSVNALQTVVVTALSDNTEMPLFPGCDKAPEMEKKTCSQNKLYEFVASELKYPEELRKDKIEGKVYVKFTVGANGLVSEPWITKSLHPAADEAALNVVRAMNKKVGAWTPARKDGSKVSMEMLLPISFVEQTSDAEKPYTYVDDMPKFPGGNDALYKYIADLIKYPAEDRNNKIQGMVITQFVVRKDGSISDITIVRGVSETIDAEARRLMESMNSMPEKWTPGRHEGKEVDVKFTLPIKFVLQEDDKENKPATSDHKTDVKESSILYPNPSTGKVNVDVPVNTHTIRVTDLSGNVLLTKKVKAEGNVELDITTLADGAYIVHVITPDQTQSLRMIKGKN